MFGSKRGGTVIAEGLKIVGSVTAEGLVEINGQIEGEIQCTSLMVSRGAEVRGTITAERVVVNGRVEGPIHGREVVLKPQAHVVGDIHHQSLAIEKGAYFQGRSVQESNASQPATVGKSRPREVLSEAHAAAAASAQLGKGAGPG
jgi:cytoskeletal protein CcmA (bactofilin family)